MNSKKVVWYGPPEDFKKWVEGFLIMRCYWHVVLRDQRCSKSCNKRDNPKNKQLSCTKLEKEGLKIWGWTTQQYSTFLITSFFLKHVFLFTLMTPPSWFSSRITGHSSSPLTPNHWFFLPYLKFSRSLKKTYVSFFFYILFPSSPMPLNTISLVLASSRSFRFT